MNAEFQHAISEFAGREWSKVFFEWLLFFSFAPLVEDTKIAGEEKCLAVAEQESGKCVWNKNKIKWRKNAEVEKWQQEEKSTENRAK